MPIWTKTRNQLIVDPSDVRADIVANFSTAISHALESSADFDAKADYEIAQAIKPLLDYIYNHRFYMLREIASIWVAQTTPLLAVAQMKADLHTLGECSHSIVAATDEMVASISEVGRTSGGVSQDATAVRAHVNASMGAVEQAVATVAGISASVSNLASKIDTLKVASEQIASIVKTIETIATQTNLLALNATIEAARAGEAGKGFAVVAGEVKSLSNQTANATEDIRSRIAALQAGMNDILEAMSSSADQVQMGTEAIRAVGGSVNRINHEVDEVCQKMVQIAAIVQEQEVATGELSRNISGTAEMVDHALEAINALGTAVNTVSATVQPLLQTLGKDPNDRQLLQLARSDHASFKKRVVDTLAGATKTLAEELADHHTCRFGKWFDKLTDTRITDSAAYERIKEPHLQVHTFGKEALTHYHNGRLSRSYNRSE